MLDNTTYPQQSLHTPELSAYQVRAPELYVYRVWCVVSTPGLRSDSMTKNQWLICKDSSIHSLAKYEKVYINHVLLCLHLTLIGVHTPEVSPVVASLERRFSRKVSWTPENWTDGCFDLYGNSNIASVYSALNARRDQILSLRDAAAHKYVSGRASLKLNSNRACERRTHIQPLLQFPVSGI